MRVTQRADESQTKETATRAKEAAMKQMQIQRPAPKPAPQPLDLRTPSGKRLQF
jgi:hypothetical protein